MVHDRVRPFFRSIYDIPAAVNYSARDQGEGGGQEKREELKDNRPCVERTLQFSRSEREHG